MKCQVCGSEGGYQPFIGRFECANRQCSYFSQKHYEAVHGVTEAERVAKKSSRSDDDTKPFRFGGEAKQEDSGVSPDVQKAIQEILDEFDKLTADLQCAVNNRAYHEGFIRPGLEAWLPNRDGVERALESIAKAGGRTEDLWRQYEQWGGRRNVSGRDQGPVVFHTLRPTRRQSSEASPSTRRSTVRVVQSEVGPLLSLMCCRCSYVHATTDLRLEPSGYVWRCPECDTESLVDETTKLGVRRHLSSTVRYGRILHASQPARQELAAPPAPSPHTQECEDTVRTLYSRPIGQHGTGYRAGDWHTSKDTSTASKGQPLWYEVQWPPEVEAAREASRAVLLAPHDQAELPKTAVGDEALTPARYLELLAGTPWDPNRWD